MIFNPSKFAVDLYWEWGGASPLDVGSWYSTDNVWNVHFSLLCFSLWCSPSCCGSLRESPGLLPDPCTVGFFWIFHSFLSSLFPFAFWPWGRECALVLWWSKTVCSFSLLGQGSQPPEENLSGTRSYLSAEFPLVFFSVAVAPLDSMALPSFHSGTLAVKQPSTVLMLQFSLNYLT